MYKEEGVATEIMRRPFSFSASFVAVFLLTFTFLASVDVLPNANNAHAEGATAEERVKEDPAPTVAATAPELPVRVEVKSVGINAAVSNPESTDVNVLDYWLTKGAVRYPGSARLGDVGTVLIFGHSSYLPVVHNKAYKAFNELGKLKKGDIVSVFSGTLEYRYRVVSVEVADATHDVIELPQTGKQLILVTCDTFAQKSARFVVKADFVGTYSPSSN